jgi:hypothetical protein
LEVLVLTRNGPPPKQKHFALALTSDSKAIKSGAQIKRESPPQAAVRQHSTDLVRTIRDFVQKIGNRVSSSCSKFPNKLPSNE